ncbi:MAG: hypothetical protein HYY17_03545 [Planctomycetes bacterium]|nr:hypothetical protein [Planctomycetota bacterium]
MTHLILLHDDVALDPRDHADAVAQRLGLAPVEARMAVRRGRGIFLDNLDEEKARAIAADLERAGVKASVVERASLPSPRKAARLERGEAALSYRIAGSEETGAVPWEAISVVSCGLVARSAGAGQDAKAFAGAPSLHILDREEDREILRANLILKMERARSGDEARRDRDRSLFERLDGSRDARIFLDLVTEDLGSWLRVSMEDFAYVPVAGSVQMGSGWGLDALVKELRARAAAAFTDLTLELLAAADPMPLAFAQVEELNRYTTWAMVRRRLGLEPEIPWAEREE